MKWIIWGIPVYKMVILLFGGFLVGFLVAAMMAALERQDEAIERDKHDQSRMPRN